MHESVTNPADHPFMRLPHRTILALSIPVTLSVMAEPITGMVDTAFVARLGASPLAALGVGTSALTTVFWIFNFLGISTQTEVAQALGRSHRQRAIEMTSLALILAAFFSLLLVAVFLPGAPAMSRLLGASGDVQTDAVSYLRIRVFGAPAVVLTFVAFGALRGMQDMRTPLYIAVAVNVMNIILDGPLIFGFGPIPALDVAGAALASVFSQWVGTVWAIYMVTRRLGFVRHAHWPDVRRLLRAGSDLFVRTGLLTLFILLTTRISNEISPEAGAANQAIRTMWLFFGLMMDGFAYTAQSLVGYFVGAGEVPVARRVAALCARWSMGTGLVLGAAMLLSTSLVIAVLVPDEAVAVFRPAWFVAMFTQPVAALAFVTDGIHWGTGDYAFMRNSMLISTVVGVVGLVLIDPGMTNAFMWVWAVYVMWLGVRALIGMTRVWPGFGRSPLRSEPAMATINA